VEKIPSAGALLRMESDEEDEEVQFKRKRKRRDASDDDEDDGTKKRIRAAASDSDDDIPPKKVIKNSKKEGKKPAKKSKKIESDDEDDEDGRAITHSYNRNDADFSDVSYVYRAIRPPNDDPSSFSGSLFGGSWLAGPAHTQDGPSLGALPWAEAPCVHCPQHDFCLEGGPVNASSCEYYESWLDPGRKLQLPKFDTLRIEEAAVGIELEGL
jgi:DNA-directed RNA polymerase III subunit RPC6